MEITEVNVYLAKEDNPKLKAFAEVKINNGLRITGMRIINGKNGLFVAMPDRRENRREEGEAGYRKHHDIVHPVNQEVRDMFTKAILDKYYEEVEKANE